MTLIQHKTAIGNVAIDDVTGVAYFTQSSLAGACGCNIGYVGNALKSVNKAVTKPEILEAEVVTAGGLQRAILFPAGGEWTLKFILSKSPDLALRMLQTGSNIYVHNLAGFKVASDAASDFNTTIDETFTHYREVMRAYDCLINKMSPSAYDMLYQAYFGMSIAECKVAFGMDSHLLLPDTAPKEQWEVHKILRGALAHTKRRDTLQDTVDFAVKKAKREIAKLK